MMNYVFFFYIIQPRDIEAFNFLKSEKNK